MKNTIRLFGFLISITLLMIQQANATIVTENLAVDVISGPGFGTTGTIAVTFDDALLSGVGDETLAQTEVDLQLELFGQIFTNIDDIDFPIFPEVDFFDGIITFIDFFIVEIDPINSTPIDDPRIGVIVGGDVVNGVWLADTFGVPEPGSIALLGLGLISIGLARKRKANAI